MAACDPAETYSGYKPLEEQIVCTEEFIQALIFNFSNDNGWIVISDENDEIIFQDID